MLTFDYTYTFPHLNLGNNFTHEHLFNAIAERETFEQFYEELTQLHDYNGGALITLKAKLNYGYTLEETFVLYELCECLKPYYNNINEYVLY